MRKYLAVQVYLAIALCGCSAVLLAAQGSNNTGIGNFGITEKLDNALEGKLYYVAEGTEKLPDFSTLKPIGTLWTTKFDVAPRDYTEGFPGMTNRTEWFALRYTGTWSVPSAGTWKFRLGADDGARWLIDGQVVADNDGTHAFAAVNAEVSLKEGDHPVELQFFQSTATMLGLQLWATAPGGREEIWSIR